MNKFVRSCISASLISGAAVFTWNNLLDERAKTSLKKAGTTTANLINHFIALYMNQSSANQGYMDAEQNKSWVEEQWRQAGY